MISLRHPGPASGSRFAPTARSTRRVTVLILLLVTGTFGIATAHDMFLKPTRFFVPENSEVRVRVLNGTFDKSENSIARNRLRDASVVTPTRRVQLDTAEWTVAGDTSTFHVHTRGPGTYVIGASMHPTVLELSADDFNLYLREDGIPDVLAERRRTGELEKPAKERYHKHVKAMIQVGSTPSQHFATAMGYPAEIIPVENPYTLSKGGTLSVRTLVDGKPAGNQYVLYGARTPDNKAIEQMSVRSDSEGIARIPLGVSGTFYIKFINMTRVQRDTVDYESKWATLTFQVR